jgi:hypothetical protein
MANDQTRKRREQRSRQSAVKHALSWADKLPDCVKDKLASLDHPSIESDEHSMYSYLLWLCGKGYLNKAKEVVIAHTC